MDATIAKEKIYNAASLKLRHLPVQSPAPKLQHPYPPVN